VKKSEKQESINQLASHVRFFFGPPNLLFFTLIGKINKVLNFLFVTTWRYGREARLELSSAARVARDWKHFF
jgi:hypothetical protein